MVGEGGGHGCLSGPFDRLRVNGGAPAGRTGGRQRDEWGAPDSHDERAGGGLAGRTGAPDSHDSRDDGVGPGGPHEGLGQRLAGAKYFSPLHGWVPTVPGAPVRVLREPQDERGGPSPGVWAMCWRGARSCPSRASGRTGGAAVTGGLGDVLEGARSCPSRASGRTGNARFARRTGNARFARRTGKGVANGWGRSPTGADGGYGRLGRRTVLYPKPRRRIDAKRSQIGHRAACDGIPGRTNRGLLHKSLARSPLT